MFTGTLVAMVTALAMETSEEWVARRLSRRRVRPAA